MTERHSKQNRFAGSIMRQRGRRGGQQTVLERHVIALEGCWCGEPLDHSWPGKNTGVPHPREEGSTMVAATEHEMLTPGDLGSFDKGTRDLLLEIVNDHKVRWRRIDGSHILLYPPDGVSRPFKVSAARQPQTNKQILEVQFMERFGLRHPKPTPPPVKKAEESVVEVEETEIEETPVAGTDMEDAVRASIATLTKALGMESLEEEALHALDENDALKKRVEAMSGDLQRARSQREALDREVTRLGQQVEKLTGLLDEAVADRDRYKGKLDALREALS